MTASPRRPSLLAVVGFATIVAAGIVTIPAFAAAQAQSKAFQNLAASSPRIWEDRGPISQLDLFWGNASPERAPVGPFTFVAEDLNGTNPKAQLRDAKGVLWGAKWDDEVRAEVAASRLAWAIGFQVDETYYVENGRIVFPGGQSLMRIGSFVDKQGSFKSPARFQRSNPEHQSKGEWTFEKHPLMADSGYSAMVLMNVIMANWDAKDSNNRLLSVPGSSGTTDWYMISDYGACFGKMGGEFSHSKYRLKDFVGNPPVISAVRGDRVYLEFKGKNAPAHASVPLQGARVFAKRVADLTLAQVEDAFRAAHASDPDLHGFARAVYGRIREVVTKVQ